MKRTMTAINCVIAIASAGTLISTIAMSFAGQPKPLIFIAALVGLLYSVANIVAIED